MTNISIKSKKRKHKSNHKDIDQYPLELDLSKLTDDITSLSFWCDDPSVDDEITIRQMILHLQNMFSVSPPLLSTLIVEQSVGAMIKTDDMEESLGFMVAVNLHQSSPVIHNFKKSLIKSTPKEKQNELQQILDDKNTPLDLLLIERMINAPLNFIPILIHRVLQDFTIAESEFKDPQFSRFIFVTRRYSNDNYIYDECNYLETRSSFLFSFPFILKSGDNNKQDCVVMIINRSDLKLIRDDMSKDLNVEIPYE